MKVSMSPEFAEAIVTVTVDCSTLGEMRETLRAGNARFAVVVDDGVVLGVFGRRELELSEPHIAVADRLPASRPPLVPHDISLDAAIAALTEHDDLDAITVVDPNGRPVGMLTQKGVLATLLEQRHSAADAITATAPIPAKPSRRQRTSIPTPLLDELHESEEMLRVVAQTTPEFIALCDAKLKIRYVNRTLEGHTFDEVVGSDLADWIAPQHRPLAEDAIDRSIRTGGVQHFDILGVGPNNEQSWYSCHVSPVLKGRCAGGVILLSRDVTREKTLEREMIYNKDDLTSVVNVTSDWAWEMDLEFNLRLLNISEDATILGHSIDQFTKVGFLSLLHPSDREAVTQQLPELVQQKQGWRNRVIRCRNSEGRYRYLETNAHPELDGDGRLIAFRGATRDITKIKQAEDAIRESEALARQQLAELTQVYDTAPVGLCVVDADLRVLRMNDRLAVIMRMPRSEILGRTLHDSVPRNAIEVEPIYRQVMTTKTPVRNRVVQGPPREGEKRGALYLISFDPLFDESGDVWACSTVLQDITDAKRVEKQLRKREEQHASAQRIAKLGHWERDIATSVVFWSDEMYRIFGISTEEFGATLESTLRYVHLDDLARVHENLRAVVADDRPYQIEYRINRPSGETRIVEARAHVIRDANGEPTYLVGTLQDITERKHVEESLAESERRYGTMLDALAEGVISVDRQGMIVSCNASATDILGLSRDELLNRSLTDPGWRLRDKNGATISPDAFRSGVARQSSQPVRNLLMGVERPDGRQVWVSINSQPVLQGNPAQQNGSVISFYDITDQRQVQKELQEHQDKLTHVARVSTMGEMATGIAHELNQPLAAIATYAYSARGLTEGAPNDIAQPLDRLLIKLEEQSVRAGSIVRRLRAFVRKSPGERTYTDLKTLIAETSSLIGNEIRSAGAVIETRFDNDLGGVLVDTVQIQQVLLNLVRNGLEAMEDTPSERKRLLIHTQNSGLDSIAISVSDHGAGLPLHDLDKIFNAFFTTKDDGMGMGLAISRSIVEDHGGQLAVFVNDEAGVTFRITLPLADSKIATP